MVQGQCALQQACGTRPDYTLAWKNLGSALRKAGHEVIGYDIDQDRVAALADVGVAGAASTRDVATKVDNIITSLPFATALDLVTGEIASAGKPVVVADTSNLTVAEKERGRKALAATHLGPHSRPRVMAACK